MSYYVGTDGRKVWVDDHETVYTVGEPDSELAMEALTYLAVNSSKAVYAEHIIDDEEGGKKGKKAKDKASGRQRGFVVRVDHEDKSRLSSAFRQAADKLLSSGVVSRFDLDESSHGSKKKRSKDKDKEEEEAPSLFQNMGSNECRIETTKRIQHQAHGVGFRVEVAEGGTHQRIHMFTAGKDLTSTEWHEALVEAVQSTGVRVVLGRLGGGGDETPAGGAAAGRGGKPKKDQALADENDWLDNLMGRCMVSKGEADKDGAKSAAAREGPNADAPGAEEIDSEAAPAPKPRPPWMRRARA